LLVNIGQLLTLSSAAAVRGGACLSELGIIEDGAVLCLGGKIVSVGTTKDALRDPWLKKNRKKSRRSTAPAASSLPGFVDSHTHPVFTHPRLIDFEKRIAGASYEEIAEAGGGIRSSIEGVRKGRESCADQRVAAALTDMARHGTTTVEAKSGYGLSLESELKSLEAIRAAAREWPGTVVPTFLGAHVVPPEYRGARRPTWT
jgi:imidazolonepropionase